MYVVCFYILVLYNVMYILVTYGLGKPITAVGRIAAWRVSHGCLQDTESEILAVAFSVQNREFEFKTFY